jgi:thiol-disulfide isomerase/thioredoxin
MAPIGQSFRHAAKSRGLTRREWLLSAALAAPATASGPGAKSPPLEVKTLDGESIQVHRQTGKVVLLDFMTTTCPTCKQASAGIQAVYRELGPKGFLPVAVAIDPQAWRSLPLYRNLYGLTFPVGLLPREEVLRYLEHPADKQLFVPTLVLLDKQGRISAKHVGWIGEEQLRSAVTELLK